MDYKKHIRDIKLDLITNKIKLEVSPPKIGGLFSFARPGNKVIRELLDNGAILTGSRAIKCYKANGNKILDRECDDWDFIVDEKTLFKICDKYKVSSDINRDSSGDYYVPIRNELVRFTQSYGGDIRVLKTNITLICKDEPAFTETKSGRIANLVYILDEKRKLSMGQFDRNPNKHDHDLKQIITRMYNL